MECAANTTGVVPAVGTAPVKLTFDDNTFFPGTMTLLTISASSDGASAADIREEGLGVTASRHFEDLIRSSLDGTSDHGFVGQLSTKRRVALELISVDVIGDLTSSALSRGIDEFGNLVQLRHGELVLIGLGILKCLPKRGDCVGAYFALGV